MQFKACHGLLCKAYKYTISTGAIVEIVNGEETSLDAYEDNIIWFENQSIYLFNSEIEGISIIESDNITLLIMVSENYIVWNELIGDEFGEHVESWYGEYGWGIYDVWIYDITSRKKTKF